LYDLQREVPTHYSDAAFELGGHRMIFDRRVLDRHPSSGCDSLNLLHLLHLLHLPIDSAEFPSYVWEVRLLLASGGDILVRYHLSTWHFFLIFFPHVELDMGDYRSARGAGYG
jgi:hypothetical protein